MELGLPFVILVAPLLFNAKAHRITLRCACVVAALLHVGIGLCMNGAMVLSIAAIVAWAPLVPALPLSALTKDTIVEEHCRDTRSLPDAHKRQQYLLEATVKPGMLAEYKARHDAIADAFPEVCQGLVGIAGVEKLTIWQAGGKDSKGAAHLTGKRQAQGIISEPARIYMHITMKPDSENLEEATGRGSSYRASHPRVQEWEEIMETQYHGGWKVLSELHDSDKHWPQRTPAGTNNTPSASTRARKCTFDIGSIVLLAFASAAFYLEVGGAMQCTNAKVSSLKYKQNSQIILITCI